MCTQAGCVTLNAPDRCTFSTGSSRSGLNLWKGPVAEDPGVVDDDVDPAKRLHSLPNDGSAPFGSCHAVVVGDRLPTESLDLKMTEPRLFDNRQEWVRAVAIDNQSRYVAAGSGRGSIRIWDADDGRLVVEL